MSFSKNKKQGIGFFKIIFCLLANFVCFGICYYCGLPMRLENVGTYFAAAAFGVVPAIVIAVISNLVYSLFYFGFSNVLMLVPTILVVLIIVAAVQYGWVDTMITSLGTMTAAAIVNMIFVFLISLLIGRAFLGNSGWLEVYNALGRHLRYHRFEASMFTVAPFAVFNTCFSWIVALFVYRISPKQTTFGFSDNINYKKRLQNRK